MLKSALIPILMILCAAAAEPPQAEISNGAITARFLLPDPENGYYRGTRFDWSGQISSLKTKNHEYFGQWFERYDAKLHDSIMGPVEEFRTGDSGLGYAEAPVGGEFVRIGVGVLKKPDEKAFQAFKIYEILDPGKWRVKQGKDSIQFTHDLNGPNGYAYRYTKKIRLVKGQPQMVIEHALKNTGQKRIETSQYNHNFFVMDSQPTGPDASVKFPFELKAVREFRGGLAEARGKEIAFLKELQMGQSTIAEFQGFGPTAADYDIRVEHRKAGAGVRIRGDVPLEKVVFWCIRKTLCPEPYVKLAADPGQETKWNYTYDFYDLAGGAAK
jgi:hypothetical protein